MNQYQPNHNLHEAIPHRTDTSPYSIHFTISHPDSLPALYLHWHEEMEFLFLTKGHLLFYIEDQSFELHAGEAIFIPPGLLHHAVHTDDEIAEFYAFVFSPQLLFATQESSQFNKYLLPVMHNNISFTTPFCHDIIWQNDILTLLKMLLNDTGELYVRGIALLIWNKFYTHFIRPKNPEINHTLHTSRMTFVINYIHENYQQNITLTDLSEIAHLSEGQLCRSFKSFTGMSPFHYLIRYRILQSCNILIETKRKITDIALSCGFNNISYYNRAFLKFMNTTPGEYRKAYSDTK